ncbi:hypothetical protein DSO57_1017146 [Entomophthora muscae]|uniref:Uncharacterized protein n=1 Tax=Entomophthora muscae TaxID=34485 RepID=A0ACC2S6L1_9FUNG|nr:hypothetical protein DSO57_1017146 [Entomophthora muscae]
MKLIGIAALYLARSVCANVPSMKIESVGLIEEIVNLFTPAMIEKLPKLLSLEPPRRLNVSREWQHNTSKQVRSYLTRSFISVCPVAKLDTFECVCTKTYSDINIIRYLPLQAYVMVAVHKPDRQIVVSYRPAITIRNWITNLKYEMAPFESGFVHKGFLAHFRSTQNRSEAIIEKLLEKYKNHSLHVTGYSLGGAIGLLSLPSLKAMLVKRQDRRHFSAALYAGPRVGDDSFVTGIHRLNIPITRYTNGNDIVSHLPPRSFGFVHAGAEVHEYIANDGTSKLKQCSQEYDEDPACGWRGISNLSAIRHLFPFQRFLPIPQYC